VYYCLTRARVCSALRFVKARLGYSRRAGAARLVRALPSAGERLLLRAHHAAATRTRVIVLQHPRERDVGIGTARIARLCLPGALLRVGIDFSDDPVVQAALASADTHVIYPGPAARDVESVAPGQPSP